MTSKPLLSIITVVRNGEKYIERTIKSVNGQTFHDYEFIIIDGASQDKTLEIVNMYKHQISQIISEPDKSHFDAMNKGLKLAKGTYVLFLNAGDELYDNSVLEKMFKVSKDADAYFGDTVIVDERGEKLGLYRGKKAPQQLTWRSMRLGPAVNHQAFVIKKSLAAEYNFVSYPICADTDWIIAGLKKCENAVNTDQIVCKSLAGGISYKYEYKTWFEHYRMYNRHFGIITNMVNHVFMVPNYLLYRLTGWRF